MTWKMALKKEVTWFDQTQLFVALTHLLYYFKVASLSLLILPVSKG